MKRGWEWILKKTENIKKCEWKQKNKRKIVLEIKTKTLDKGRDQSEPKIKPKNVITIGKWTKLKEYVKILGTAIKKMEMWKLAADARTTRDIVKHGCIKS
jgi:hypothetical protein